MAEIDRIQAAARAGDTGPPPVAGARAVTPKGWTGPKVVDGKPVEGTWRAHQVPLAEVRTNAEHRAQLEAWMRSYRPEELFDDEGRPAPDSRASPRRAPVGWAPPRTPTAGCSPGTSTCPTSATYGVDVPAPGTPVAEPTRMLGRWLRDVMVANSKTRNFRVVGPDETASNRLDALYEATGKAWEAATLDTDENLAVDGRVMEILSEHTCQGWLEGYLLTGRHGLFNCYEAFTHIVDSMFNQHAKWLEESSGLAVAPAGAVADLPALIARLAPGPQRLLASGPGLHRPRHQQAGRAWCAPTCRRTPTACSPSPTTACEPQLHQRRSWPASSPGRPG